MQLPSNRLLLTLGLALVTTAGACAKDDGDDFKEGGPQSQDVALVVPGNAAAGSALTADGTTAIARGLVNQQADFYKLTRDVTVVVNTATVSVLTLVKTVTNYPPTKVEMDTAIWGPYTDP